VVEKTRYINGPTGARCTLELKRRIRTEWEKDKQNLTYIWGFEYGKKEEMRADRIKQTIPHAQHRFPLIEHKLTKEDAINLIQVVGIEIPTMYRLGFQNSNCVGCVKGGAAYWNRIRKYFPDHFNRMAKLEREIGRSCLRKCFLDELDPSEGRDKPPLVQECGASGEGCEIQRSIQYTTRE
jgi:hypothetical protein